MKVEYIETQVHGLFEATNINVEELWTHSVEHNQHIDNEYPNCYDCQEASEGRLDEFLSIFKHVWVIQMNTNSKHHQSDTVDIGDVVGDDNIDKVFGSNDSDAIYDLSDLLSMANTIECDGDIISMQTDNDEDIERFAEIFSEEQDYESLLAKFNEIGRCWVNGNHTRDIIYERIDFMDTYVLCRLHGTFEKIQ